ncbi:MAG: Hsp20/alpha crystallin family protein [Anaerolineae bacterium]
MERVSLRGTPVFRPNTDVYLDSRQRALVVKMELAGIDPDQVNLEIEENVLRVTGVRVNDRPPEAAYHQMEITYGPFERLVPLAADVDPSQARAEYHNGYLEITVPLRPRRPSRRIPIISEESEGGEQ